MSDTNRELISAMMDGELNEFEQRRALKALLRNEPLANDWARFHVIGDVMRKDLSNVDAAGLLQRVNDALSDEPELPARAGTRRFGLLKPLGGLALAASVATIAILGVRTLNHDTQRAPNLIASQGRPAVVAETSSAVSSPAQPRRTARGEWDRHAMDTDRAALQWHELQPSVAARLNTYLVNHNQYVGSGVPGVLPYARLVGNDSND